MKVDRRTVLIGGGAGIGLILAFALRPGGARSVLMTNEGEEAFTNYIKIARDGRITVAVPQTETGQGIWTALPQVIADELGAAWETVGVEPAPFSEVYANPLAKEQGWPQGIRVTVGSTSVRAFEGPFRNAAAVARSMLVGAAADRWNVDPSDCQTADGFVLNGPRTFTFGELAEEAAGRSAPRNPPLRQDTKGRLLGQPLQRLDGPAKATGAMRFAADVRVPEMLYAAARLAPPNGRLQGYSRDSLNSISGVRHVAARDDWLAVVAKSWWAAERAVRAAAPRFSGEVMPADPRELYDHALANGGSSEWFARGDYEGTVRGSRPLAATYYVAPSQHLGLESITSTARLRGGELELWAPTQSPDRARALAERAAPGSTVRFYPMPAGEPAGRSMEADAIPIVVALARATEAPVQLNLSPTASQTHDHVSGGALARLTALPGTAGITAAWRMHVATVDGLGAALAERPDRNGGARPGATAMDGSVPPYGVPNVAIDVSQVAVPYRAGYMRGSPQREFAFFTESFIDELAHAAGIEPLAFRMSMLGGNGRLARCLQGAARLARWDGGGAGSMMGIAGVSAFGSYIGLVATASIEEGMVKVRRLVAAVDCGRVINPSVASQQIESGLIWALAQATVAQPEWIAGMPRARPIGHLGLPRIGETPEIAVELIPSSEAPGGISGLGTTVLAPAVANAIFAGSGKRMRSLPFDPMGA